MRSPVERSARMPIMPLRNTPPTMQMSSPASDPLGLEPNEEPHATTAYVTSIPVNASLGWLQIFALGLGGVSAAGLAARASQRRGRQVSLSNVSASEVSAVTVLEPGASVIAPEPSAATE